jgi:DNA-binding response OmpR family regulator
VLRRTAVAPGPDEVELGELHVDFVRMTAVRMGRDVALSSREFRVLRALAQRRGQTVARDELLRAAWSADEAVTERTVDAHIKNLRKKIELDPANPVFLKTVHREGYVLIS